MAKSSMKKSVMKKKSGMKSAMKKKSGSKAMKAPSEWQKAVAKAREALGITGFCAVGGKSKEGQALYAKAKSLHKK